MPDPERNFARVETALRGQMRLVPDGRLRPLLSCGSLGAPMPFPDTMRSELPEVLLHFIEAMDAKLNTILTLLNLQSLYRDFPIAVLVHDISGAGLRFTSAQPVPVGAGVEIVLTLGAQPHVLVSALGLVIRCDTQGQDPLWVVEFREMPDAEREKIIQYVVARQREQLRERRLTTL